MSNVNRKTKHLQKDVDQMQQMMNQLGLHLGIYQSLIGDLPAEVVQDVYKALNPTLVTHTFGEFVSHVRDTAAKLAERARAKLAAEQELASREGGSSSPYSGPIPAAGIPQLARSTQDNAPKEPVQPSRIYMPVSRS